VVKVSGNSYKYIRKSLGKHIVAVACGMSLLVVGIGEYSIKKGIMALAQGEIQEDLVEPISCDGIGLKEFSQIPAIKEAMVFVEETDIDELYSVEEPIQFMAGNYIDDMDDAFNRLSSIDVEDIEKQLVESYGLNSDYKVTLGDEVGVSSEVRKLVTPGTPTNKNNTLLEVRSAAACVDDDYEGTPVKLTKRNRELVERLVMGEAGGEGFIGAALVAQTIRDTMLYDNEFDLMKIKRKRKYSGSLKIKPNKEVLDAVEFIFDNGGYIVKHRLIYFYSYKSVKSKFHESREFVIQHGGHRFFDEID